MSEDKKKVVAVTGASKGLGRELARALVEGGAHVALLARPSSELESVAADLGNRATPVACDVGVPQSVRQAFEVIGNRLGRLDGLVNNAAVCFINKIDTIGDEELATEVATNFLGPIYCVRSALPIMRKIGGGHIINISSQSVRFHMPYLTMYAATKGGLETFSAALRSELKGENVRVTTLRLGGVKTGKGLTRSWSREKKDAYLAAAQASGLLPLTGGWMEPQSVARAVVDLLATSNDVSPEFMEIAGR